jgi:hypothetical protein
MPELLTRTVPIPLSVLVEMLPLAAELDGFPPLP